jgi:lysophospholipase L1-like esterase
MVSLGDSFISGEAGRWQGNAALTQPFGDVDGTDRAAFDCNAGYTWCGRNPERVYGSSYLNGCDRSDVAEIRSAEVAVDERVNLACSGAVTKNVLRAVDGGVSFKGEPSQADQLADVAARDDVRLVVLSIGGNDLGFSNILTTCAEDFLTPIGAAPCKPSQDPVFQAGLAALGPKVRAALASVRAAMASAGYSDSDYRLVLQSYPSPLPTGEQYRYDESYRRYAEGGCPFFDSDSTWAHDTIVPAIAATLHDAAQAQHADFLDLQAAFDGHEVCSREDQQATDRNNLAEPVSPGTAEWIRFVTLLFQGTPQESLHPNAYGQQALGDCLGKLWAAGPGSFRCVNTAEHGPQEMLLYRLP